MKVPALSSIAGWRKEHPVPGLGKISEGTGPAGMYASILTKEIGSAVSKQLRRRGGRGSSDRPQLPAPEALESRERRVRVDGQKNSEFCAVVHSPVGANAHGGYLHALTFPLSTEVMTSGSFPLRLLGLIHLKNSVVQLRPVAVNSTIKIRSRVKEFGTHRRGVTVTILAEIWDESGELAMTDESLYLSKQASSSQKESSSHSAGQNSAASTHPDPREGMRLTARWRLAADTGRQYAKVSGDANPIHLSAASAKLFGLQGSIAHGMYCASRALGRLAADPSAPGEWTVEFGAPVLLPATVELWRDRSPSGAERRVRGIGRKARKNFELVWSPSSEDRQ